LVRLTNSAALRLCGWMVSGLDKSDALVLLWYRSCMFDNPYHNWQHAFDVTQVSMCCLILATILGVLVQPGRCACRRATHSNSPVTTGRQHIAYRCTGKWTEP
jgi:hypothetical protein